MLYVPLYYVLLIQLLISGCDLFIQKVSLGGL